MWSCRATAAARRLSSATLETSTNHTPSSKVDLSSSATFNASVVLPTPPGPVRVTRPRLLEGFDHGILLELTADQVEVPDREVALGRGQRSQRWELGGKPFHAQLEDVLLVRQVAESMGSQIFEAAPLGEAVLDESSRCLGDERLTPVPTVTDASGPMDVDADVV